MHAMKSFFSQLYTGIHIQICRRHRHRKCFSALPIYVTLFSDADNPEFNHSAGIFHTVHSHQKVFFIPVSTVVNNYCYFSIVCKLSASPLFKNTLNILVRACLGDLSRDAEQ